MFRVCNFVSTRDRSRYEKRRKQTREERKRKKNCSSNERSKSFPIIQPEKAATLLDNHFLQRDSCKSDSPGNRRSKIPTLLLASHQLARRRSRRPGKWYSKRGNFAFAHRPLCVSLLSECTRLAWSEEEKIERRRRRKERRVEERYCSPADDDG